MNGDKDIEVIDGKVICQKCDGKGRVTFASPKGTMCTDCRGEGFFSLSVIPGIIEGTKKWLNAVRRNRYEISKNEDHMEWLLGDVTDALTGRVLDDQFDVNATVIPLLRRIGYPPNHGKNPKLATIIEYARVNADSNIRIVLIPRH